MAEKIVLEEKQIYAIDQIWSHIANAPGIPCVLALPDAEYQNLDVNSGIWSGVLAMKRYRNGGIIVSHT